MVAFTQSSQRGSFLALAAIATLIVSSSLSVALGAPTDCTNNQLCCPSAIAERLDCGYPGITKDQCLQRKCCWDDTVKDSKVPQCFGQKALVSVCPADKNIRTDCGFKGISQDQCTKRKCCWDSSTTDPRYPWCFSTQSTCTP